MSEAKQAPPSARETALQSLLAVEEGSYANLTRRAASGEKAGADKALANELVQGVTRRRGTLDWALGQLLREPMAKLTPPIRNILRMGAYQLLYLDRIPDRAAVDESVKLAHRYGHAGVANLVNGVLRNLARRKESLVPPTFAADPRGALMHRYALPPWLADRWLADFGDEAEAIGAWSIEAPHLSLRINTLKTDRETVLASLAAAGVAAEPSPLVPEGIQLKGHVEITGLPGFQEGWWYVQDEAAMLVSRVVGARPGETVIDVGAAPGGKTTHLAQLMGNEGEIWAVDQRGGRLRLLEENLQRLGVRNVRAVEQDALDLAGLPMADAILLDVPCSGLGVLPRKPDLRWRQTPEAIARLAVTQGELLDAAAAHLKPGGRLVYSTCTIGRDENQEVIEAFLARHPQLTLGELAPALPERFRPAVEAGGMVQLLPQRHGVDGFFIALIVRPSAEGAPS